MDSCRHCKIGNHHNCDVPSNGGEGRCDCPCDGGTREVKNGFGEQEELPLDKSSSLSEQVWNELNKIASQGDAELAEGFDVKLFNSLKPKPNDDEMAHAKRHNSYPDSYYDRHFDAYEEALKSSQGSKIANLDGRCISHLYPSDCEGETVPITIPTEDGKTHTGLICDKGRFEIMREFVKQREEDAFRDSQMKEHAEKNPVNTQDRTELLQHIVQLHPPVGFSVDHWDHEHLQAEHDEQHEAMEGEWPDAKTEGNIHSHAVHKNAGRNGVTCPKCQRWFDLDDAPQDWYSHPEVCSGDGKSTTAKTSGALAHLSVTALKKFAVDFELAKDGWACKLCGGDDFLANLAGQDICRRCKDSGMEKQATASLSEQVWDDLSKLAKADICQECFEGNHQNCVGGDCQCPCGSESNLDDDDDFDFGDEYNESDSDDDDDDDDWNRETSADNCSTCGHSANSHDVEFRSKDKESGAPVSGGCMVSKCKCKRSSSHVKNPKQPWNKVTGAVNPIVFQSPNEKPQPSQAPAPQTGPSPERGRSFKLPKNTRPAPSIEDAFEELNNSGLSHEEIRDRKKRNADIRLKVAQEDHEKSKAFAVYRFAPKSMERAVAFEIIKDQLRRSQSDWHKAHLEADSTYAKNTANNLLGGSTASNKTAFLPVLLEGAALLEGAGAAGAAGAEVAGAGAAGAEVAGAGAGAAGAGSGAAGGAGGLMKNVTRGLGFGKGHGGGNGANTEDNHVEKFVPKSSTGSRKTEFSFYKTAQAVKCDYCGNVAKTAVVGGQTLCELHLPLSQALASKESPGATCLCGCPKSDHETDHDHTGVYDECAKSQKDDDHECEGFVDNENHYADDCWNDGEGCKYDGMCEGLANDGMSGPMGSSYWEGCENDAQEGSHFCGAHS
jgi:hypothetical protein